jgi:hypothetical protein
MGTAAMGMGAAARAMGATAVAAVPGVVGTEIGIVRPIRGVAPETEVPLGGWLARGGIGGFRDTPMIARAVPGHHQGKP